MKNIVKKVRLSLVVAGVLSIVSGGLAAQNIPDRGPIKFEVYDTNNDRVVSESEFYNARANRMSKKAKQGKPMRNAGNAPEFGLFDTNKDGKLTKVELLEGQLEQILNKRTNRGSKKQGMKKARGQGNMQGMQRGNRQGNMQRGNKKGSRQGNTQGMKRNMPSFEYFDLNSDGYLTSAEMEEARIKRMKQNAAQGKMMRNSGNQTKFSDIDRNNDGRVDRQEFISNQMRKR